MEEKEEFEVVELGAVKEKTRDGGPELRADPTEDDRAP